jgi:hypothetical protein
MPEGKFPLGEVVITAHAKDVLHPEDVPGCLVRHVAGDWGDLDDEDKRENELALTQDRRLFSVYHDRNKNKLYIITEWDRSTTTILLPNDY